MKNIRKMFLCLAVGFVLIALPQAVIAVEIEEDPYAMITFTAHVPDGFTEDIWLKVKNQSTDITQTLGLAESVDFTRSVMLMRNATHTIEVFIANGDYLTDLEESYIFSTVETVEFNVFENRGEQQGLLDVTENDNPEKSSTDNPNGEGSDIDGLTGLESADSVWERFVSVCSVMDNNPNFEQYLSVYSAALIKQEYLKDKDTNTEETWNAMTPLERYILHISYTLPKTYLFHGNIDSENDFVSEVESDIKKLDNIEGGDVIRDEVISLWSWHYKYFLHTGTFYDFYADYEGEYAGTSLDESQREIDEIKQAISDSGMQDEIRNALEEYSKEQEKENGLITWIKNNIISLSILVIVIAGIAFIVTTFLVRHKNMQNAE